MPPKVKITKEMILDAAFQIAQEEGYGNISARTIADRLHCSTQPVMYNFKTIEELKQAVYQIADRYHSQYIAPKGRAGMSPLTELGLNYIRFAAEEKRLFQFLFQSNQFAGKSLNDLICAPESKDLLAMVSAAIGCDPEEAKTVFLSMFIRAHGCASLIANNAMAYDEAQLIRLLTGFHPEQLRESKINSIPEGENR